MPATLTGRRGRVKRPRQCRVWMAWVRVATIVSRGQASQRSRKRFSMPGSNVGEGLRVRQGASAGPAAAGRAVPSEPRVGRCYNPRVPFITFEGIEGSGKTTLLRRLAQQLGDRAVLTREPGGTATGRAIRSLLLDPASHGLTPMAELLLYFADRAQNVAEVMRPALAEGRVVLCDRHVESSLAYQGHGRGLSLPAIRQLASLATGGLRPDLIVLVDVPVAVGLARVRQRGSQDRLECEDVAFHERVRQGFLDLREEEPSRWLLLDGTLPEDAVFHDLVRVLRERGLPTGGA